MITPLMLLLSSINERFTYDAPVDIGYLNRNDRSIITSEAERLGVLASSDDVILLAPDVFGVDLPDIAQIVNGSVVDVHRGTAVLLNRIREAYAVYKKATAVVHNTDTGEDLDTDVIILHLEGNPRYVYTYVYQVMKTRGLDYTSKMSKIVNLYLAIHHGMGGENLVTDNSALLQRLTLHSSIEFWSGLIQTDIMRHYGTMCNITEADLETIKKELASLGFYGFVNPLKMYIDFSSARAGKKTELKIDTEVLEFLTKVVQSGG